MVLVEVVYQVPEALFVLLLRAEEVEVDLEVPLVIQLATDVLIETGGRLEVCLKLLMSTRSFV